MKYLFTIITILALHTGAYADEIRPVTLPPDGVMTISNTVVKIPTASEVRKAMKAHIKAHPECYVCGAKHSLLKTPARIGWSNRVEKITLPAYTNTMVLNGHVHAEVIDSIDIWLEGDKLIPYIIKGKWKANAVHHDKSQHAFPELAATDSNLYTLCYRLHGVAGHGIWIGKGSWTHSNKRLKETLDALKAVYEDIADYRIDPTVHIVNEDNEGESP